MEYLKTFKILLHIQLCNDTIKWKDILRIALNEKQRISIFYESVCFHFL